MNRARKTADGVGRRLPADDSRFDALYKELMGRLPHDREQTDEQIMHTIDDLLTGNAVYLPLSERTRVRRELFNSVRRLDILQELLDDDTVTEIMINGTEGIFTERDGTITKWHKRFEDKEKLENLIQQIVASCNRVVNESSPVADARLPNGSRVNVVMEPVAIRGPVVTIRRFRDEPIRMRDLIGWGSISPEAAQFLQVLVRAGYNMFISGGTGSGKTTFLNALSEYIPREERIITIEDNAELNLQGLENLVSLEARKAGQEGTEEISIRDLIRTSLRMRPDRIIVGEVRGKEMIDLITANSTGHDGSLSTGHGNNPRDMLARMEIMFCMGDMDLPLNAIRRQIAAGLDIMIHLGRLRDRTRRVLEILEIDGYDYETGEIRVHTLFKFREESEDANGRIKGALVRQGDLTHTDKLAMAGLPVP